MVEPIGGEAGDGPAVLRLRKWDQSQFQLNLSEFREAVVSPTREALVLLSYQSEALLLPLIAGKFSQLLPDLSRDRPWTDSKFAYQEYRYLLISKGFHHGCQIADCFVYHSRG